MIVFDLHCREGGHRFEGWFGSSEDYARQREAGMLACPVCGRTDVAKAVMAPSIGRKGNQLPAPAPLTAASEAPAGVVSNAGPGLPAEALAMLQAVALAQAEALKTSRWVGGDFAEQARAMHYGERDHELIHGQATADEARELLEEGVTVAPLLIPVVPPEQTN